MIIQKSNWPQIKRPDLSSNQEINNKTLETISQGHWPLLENIELGKHRCDMERVAKFYFESQVIESQIHTLRSKNDNLLESLLKKNCSLLEELDLSCSRITQDEIEVIVKICNFSQLKHLNLSDNKINDDRLAILCQGNWPLLKILDSSKTEITKKALIHFLFNANWPNLKEITLTLDPISQVLAYSFIKKDLSAIERLLLNDLEVPSAIGKVMKLSLIYK